MRIRAIKIGFLGIVVLIGCSWQPAAQQLAFPGAEGYGKYASGGRGNGSTGRIAIVTNLEDDVENPPEGSLRWAFQQGTEVLVDPIIGEYTVYRPLTIVFRVGGVINLEDDLKVSRKHITIAGQTAPGDGICIRGATVNLGGSTNLIVRYIRFRPGDEKSSEVSALRIENGGNFIIDHCSMSWAIEETTHFSSSPNFTVQWCIVSESLYSSIHKKGSRGYATQWGGEYASYHHNLLAHHNSRMPRINGSNENDIEALVDYRNNVNYNWGSSGAFYGGEWENTNGQGFCKTNVVNNYFIPGPATSSSVYFARPSLVREGRTLDGYADWYFAGNTMLGHTDLTNNNWLGVDGSNVGGIENIRSDIEAVQVDGELEDYDNYTETAEDAYLSVLENAGAILPKRDVIDERVIKEVNGDLEIVRYAYEIDGQVTPIKGINSGLIDTQKNLVPNDAAEGTTAWDVYTTTPESEAPVDNDRDGMPDEWELENGLNPNDSLDFRLIAANGYSNLENYLNELTVVVSANEIMSANKFKVFPNPVTDVFHIQSSEIIKKVDVFSLSGKKVFGRANKNGIHELGIQNLPTGIYMLKAVSEKETFTQKIVKK
ncbi:T9SS type A sorting domain-containing protein [uncultured Draconibacterium sp.]|uniref:T9SS type A sorting domain-containing protein n=1 Tax=uncultured Draconibacterium sp. TaxID=1573823 RepID=UPI0025FDE1D5|nr:T9SS type A sorting domain-containing protein [uncultured Draconibacterium sp.]